MLSVVQSSAVAQLFSCRVQLCSCQLFTYPVVRCSVDQSVCCLVDTCSVVQLPDVQVFRWSVAQMSVV